jgi:hypothetical protein
VPISTVSFGTPYGYVDINNQRQPVPVDEETLKKISELSDGTHYSASNLEQLKEVDHPAAGSDRLRDRQGRREHRMAAPGIAAAGPGRGGRPADQPQAAGV